jgi:hypothetical protein
MNLSNAIVKIAEKARNDFNIASQDPNAVEFFKKIDSEINSDNIKSIQEYIKENSKKIPLILMGYKFEGELNKFNYKYYIYDGIINVIIENMDIIDMSIESLSIKEQVGYLSILQGLKFIKNDNNKFLFNIL